VKARLEQGEAEKAARRREDESGRTGCREWAEAAGRKRQTTGAVSQVYAKANVTDPTARIMRPAQDMYRYNGQAMVTRIR